VLRVWSGSWRRVEISGHNGVKFAAFVSFLLISNQTLTDHFAQDWKLDKASHISYLAEALARRC